MIPDDRNLVTVNQFTVNKLSHTASRGFWDEQPYRFELVYSETGSLMWDTRIDVEEPPSGGFMLWIEPHNNYLNAQIVYNWFVSRFELYGAAILWDMAENPEPGYCVWVGAYGEWMENYEEMTRVD